MRVAAIQFAPILKQPKKNLWTAAQLVKEAAENGAELLVLPELCTTGYTFFSRTEAAPFAEVLDPQKGNSMRMFTTLVSKYDIGIAWGAMEVDSGTGTLYNSQVLALPSRKYITYRKNNMWGSDWCWATPGNVSPPIVNFRGKKVGLLICKDIRDKSSKINDLYQPGDADIVAFSSNFGRGEYPASKWVEFAIENRVWLVVSNRYGEELNNDFGHGGICVISPAGQVHCEGIRFDAPCIVYADIP